MQLNFMQMSDTSFFFTQRPDKIALLLKANKDCKPLLHLYKYFETKFNSKQ